MEVCARWSLQRVTKWISQREHCSASNAISWFINEFLVFVSWNTIVRSNVSLEQFVPNVKFLALWNNILHSMEYIKYQFYFIHKNSVPNLNSIFSSWMCTNMLNHNKKNDAFFNSNILVVSPPKKELTSGLE